HRACHRQHLHAGADPDRRAVFPLADRLGAVERRGGAAPSAAVAARPGCAARPRGRARGQPAAPAARPGDRAAPDPRRLGAAGLRARLDVRRGAAEPRAGRRSVTTLYHASSSYYSMIARLALLEAGVAFTGRRMDIHIAKEQLQPWYVALNPHMTVPTLVDGEHVWRDSRDILAVAAERAGARWLRPQAASEAVVAAPYRLPIERLT